MLLTCKTVSRDDDKALFMHPQICDSDDQEPILNRSMLAAETQDYHAYTLSVHDSLFCLYNITYTYGSACMLVIFNIMSPPIPYCYVHYMTDQLKIPLLQQ